MRKLVPLLAVATAALVACATPSPPPAMQRVQHLVVIYAENHSFDNLYGLFPGADGVANATPEQRTQLEQWKAQRQSGRQSR